MRRRFLRSIILLITCICLEGCVAETKRLDLASKPGDNEEKSWKLFSDGVDSLQVQGDRKKAAVFFDEVAREYPDSKYAKDSEELAGHLRQMAQEDKQWVEPPDLDVLPVARKIAYYIYHLRDVNCYQFSSPGFCSVLDDSGQKQGASNAAMKLKEIGEPAIPALIQLLGDRRPIRSVGYWRIYMPSRTVLRYQDAAIEILAALVPASFYNRLNSAAYFSTESLEVQQHVIASISSWYQSSLGKTKVEKEWLAVAAAPGIYQQMGLLEDLALAHGKKEQVLATLRQMCAKKHPLQLPQISWVMCELGDYNEVGVVEQAYISGQYDVSTSLPDDAAAGSNAGTYTLRQVILYGTDLQREAIQRNVQRPNDPLHKRGFLFTMLVNTANGDFGKLPKTYDRSRFPLKMLVDALTDKQECGSGSDGLNHWIIRVCDVAANAIQKFTGKQFGYDEMKRDVEKDKAIGRILTWWESDAGDWSATRPQVRA